MSWWVIVVIVVLVVAAVAFAFGTALVDRRRGQAVETDEERLEQPVAARRRWRRGP